MNLRFLNVGSAAALATTVTGISLSKVLDGGPLGIARDGRLGVLAQTDRINNDPLPGKIRLGCR